VGAGRHPEWSLDLAPEVVESEKRVAPLELFFDLVFVFAVTQVTQLMSHHPTWEGLGQGMLVLIALWWAWGAYAWLTNYIAADEGVERLLMFAVMGAILIAALAVPHAFSDHALLFGVAYAIARWLHIFIWAEANEDVATGQAIARLARTALPGPALLIVAGLVDDGTLRAALWIVGLSIDYAGPYVYGVSGFRVSAGHFAERFSLIVIIALGESIVALGTGVPSDLTAGVLTGAALGLVVACGLWWAYFDVVAVVAERRFRQMPADLRLRIARDSYSYLHLPMIAGIVLVALGVKKTLAHVDEPLETVPAVALFGGIALYYAAHVAFRLRNLGTINRIRLVAVVAALALIFAGREVDALVAVALAAALTSAVIAYEAIHFRESRYRIRHEQAGM
jgi:low temperature requirement protein LtrA